MLNYTAPVVTNPFNNTDLTWLHGAASLFPLYAIAFPTLAAFGVALNIITLVTFAHPRLRQSISVKLISASVVADIAFLVCFVVTTMPSALLAATYLKSHGVDAMFWTVLNVAQSLFVAAQTLSQMTYCIGLWYLTAVMFEQLAVTELPSVVTMLETGDNGMKAIMALLSACFLAHLMLFLKFVRRTILFADSVVALRMAPTASNDSMVIEGHTVVCMSLQSRSQMYQLYDRYICFTVSVLCPLCVAAILVACLTLMWLKKRRHRNEDNTTWNIDEAELVRIFKRGRSHELIMLLGFVYLTAYTVTSILYVMAVRSVPVSDVEYLSGDCNLVPLDNRFDHTTNSQLVYAYHVIQVLQASTKLFVIFIGFGEFRNVLLRCCHRKRSSTLSYAFRRCVLCPCACTKTEPLANEQKAEKEYELSQPRIQINGPLHYSASGGATRRRQEYVVRAMTSRSNRVAPRNVDFVTAFDNVDHRRGSVDNVSAFHNADRRRDNVDFVPAFDNVDRTRDSVNFAPAFDNVERRRDSVDFVPAFDNVDRRRDSVDFLPAFDNVDRRRYDVDFVPAFDNVDVYQRRGSVDYEPEFDNVNWRRDDVDTAPAFDNVDRMNYNTMTRYSHL